MCIIVAKKKGVKLPSKNILETCFNKNSDGAGLMYVQNGQVIIDKGYMDFKSFYKRLQKLEKRLGNLTDRAIVMHFRIGTQGKNDKATTHPFPISKDIKDLKATYFKTDLGMVHNGIMSKFNYDRTLSDTQLFIKDFVSVIKKLKKDFYRDNEVMELLKSEIDYSKLCFLDKNENIYYIGNKIEDKGVIYSNESYKSYVYKAPKYNYTYSYDNQFDDKYDLKYKEYYIDDFIDKVKEYSVLSQGDKIYYNNVWYDIKSSDFIIVDKNYNVYDVFDGVVSLLGTNVHVYDRYYIRKTLYFKGTIL